MQYQIYEKQRKLGSLHGVSQMLKAGNLLKDKNREDETAEEVDMEYISLHRHIRNTPSDTEGQPEHQLRGDRST